ncbi:MAG: hypothetical protein LBU89_14720 [Fibromonadaceae bacterium]|jgi:transposase|nr:hypothetical protein [Fibromonadaceae bacterium]
MVESCSTKDYPKFGRLPQDTVERKVEKLKGWIWENDSEIPRNRLSVSNDCILNIVDLVERRRVYFHVFHGINMSEWNEAALYCFWIIKLQPFVEIPPPNAKAKQINKVNSMIAVRLLCRTINSMRRINGKGRIGQLNLGNLIHTFRYQDISKEAIMTLFESLISA